MGEVNNLKISKEWKEETKEAKPKRKGMDKQKWKPWPKNGGHNREPSEQSYYCGSGSFMGFSCWLLFTLGSLVFIFVKYMFLAKAKRKGMDKKENMTIWAKKVGHNRGPPEQSYYWGSRWLMDYPLEKLFGCNVLIRF